MTIPACHIQNISFADNFVNTASKHTAAIGGYIRLCFAAPRQGVLTSRSSCPAGDGATPKRLSAPAMCRRTFDFSQKL